MARVLKPGGRAVVAEISFSDPLPVTEVQAIADWFR
jgi:ubiquinone/menaquinone biosynthesis C-methylase UbiE